MVRSVVPKRRKVAGRTLLGYVLDRSGSMQTVERVVPNMFNDYMDQQKKLDGELLVTLVQFDDKYEFVVKGVSVKDVPFMVPPSDYPVDGQFAFRPRGSTALYDAVGQTISYLEGEATPEDKVLVVIHTDGLENSSQEYTLSAIKGKIAELDTDDSNWSFVFLGSGLDAQRAGANIGVRATSTYSHSHDSFGYAGASAALSLNTSTLRQSARATKLDAFVDPNLGKAQVEDEGTEESE